jgi:hypothetical protein
VNTRRSATIPEVGSLVLSFNRFATSTTTACAGLIEELYERIKPPELGREQVLAEYREWPANRTAGLIAVAARLTIGRQAAGDDRPLRR